MGMNHLWALLHVKLSSISPSWPCEVTWVLSGSTKSSSSWMVFFLPWAAWIQRWWQAPQGSWMSFFSLLRLNYKQNQQHQTCCLLFLKMSFRGEMATSPNPWNAAYSCRKPTWKESSPILLHLSKHFLRACPALSIMKVKPLNSMPLLKMQHA